VFLERSRGGRIPVRSSSSLLALAIALSACSSESPVPPIPLAAPSASAPVEPRPVSAKGRVNFKGGRRYADDLARALSLPRTELCHELSSFDCVDGVHKIALGGVSPYEGAIYRPLRERTLSTVNAVDRIALTACTERARRDVEAPERAALFAELVRSPSGAGPSAEAIGAVTARLYTQLLGRTPEAAEREALGAFYTELATELGPAAPQRFAALACYAVASSEEALFY
jgi:hypothetical protein